MFSILETILWLDETGWNYNLKEKNSEVRHLIFKLTSTAITAAIGFDEDNGTLFDGKQHTSTGSVLEGHPSLRPPDKRWILAKHLFILLKSKSIQVSCQVVQC